MRVQQLQMVLSKFLCGLEPPVLRLQKTPLGDVLVPALTSPVASPDPTPQDNQQWDEVSLLLCLCYLWCTVLAVSTDKLLCYFFLSTECKAELIRQPGNIYQLG